jgi:hypothetical protein
MPIECQEKDTNITKSELQSGKLFIDVEYRGIVKCIIHCFDTLLRYKDANPQLILVDLTNKPSSTFSERVSLRHIAVTFSHSYMFNARLHFFLPAYS